MRTGARGLPLHSQRGPARLPPAPPTNARSLHFKRCGARRRRNRIRPASFDELWRILYIYIFLYICDIYGQEAGSLRVIRTVLHSWSKRGPRQGGGRQPWGLTGLAPHPVHVPSVAQGPRSRSHSLPAPSGKVATRVLPATLPFCLATSLGSSVPFREG